MKCPHCNYEHGYNEENDKKKIGKEGDFYVLSNEIGAIKENQCGDGNYGFLDQICIFACPKCKKLFI